MSKDGQKIIEDEGYISVNENAEAYKASGLKGTHHTGRFHFRISGNGSIS